MATANSFGIMQSSSFATGEDLRSVLNANVACFSNATRAGGAAAPLFDGIVAFSTRVLSNTQSQLQAEDLTLLKEKLHVLCAEGSRLNWPATMFPQASIAQLLQAMLRLATYSHTTEATVNALYTLTLPSLVFPEASWVAAYPALMDTLHQLLAIPSAWQGTRHYLFSLQILTHRLQRSPRETLAHIDRWAPLCLQLSCFMLDSSQAALAPKVRAAALQLLRKGIAASRAATQPFPSPQLASCAASQPFPSPQLSAATIATVLTSSLDQCLLTVIATGSSATDPHPASPSLSHTSLSTATALSLASSCGAALSVTLPATTRPELLAGAHALQVHASHLCSI